VAGRPRKKTKARARARVDTLRALGVPADPASAGWRIVRRSRYLVFALLGAEVTALEPAQREVLRATIGDSMLAAMPEHATRARAAAPDRATAERYARELTAAGMRAETLVEAEYDVLPPANAPPLTVETEKAMQRLVRRLVERGVRVENEEL
jgi:hypothetical protein